MANCDEYECKKRFYKFRTEKGQSMNWEIDIKKIEPSPGMTHGPMVELAGRTAASLALNKRYLNGKVIKKCSDKCQCLGIRQPKDNDPNWTKFDKVTYKVKSNVVLKGGKTVAYTFTFTVQQSVITKFGYCQIMEEELKFCSNDFDIELISRYDEELSEKEESIEKHCI